MLLVINQCSKQHRWGWKQLLEFMVATGKLFTERVAILAGIGLIIGSLVERRCAANPGRHHDSPARDRDPVLLCIGAVGFPMAPRISERTTSSGQRIIVSTPWAGIVSCAVLAHIESLRTHAPVVLNGQERILRVDRSHALAAPVQAGGCLPRATTASSHFTCGCPVLASQVCVGPSWATS